ncbi:hypothetical protein BDZ89DRAFT_1056097 [Hymenopellis radicata]|nr:hypothetical protein BDZ89DRAFT_1066074 [Hymenopellis radicata]KAF9055524.1 hypothetical protein BDZ89DRAFT_1056097 [Hymenopellis radicata]
MRQLARVALSPVVFEFSGASAFIIASHSSNDFISALDLSLGCVVNVDLAPRRSTAFLRDGTVYHEPFNFLFVLPPVEAKDVNT